MAIRTNKASQPHASLAGASVIVTRPSASSTGLKQRVRALGGEAIGLPGLSLRAVADAATARRALRLAQGAHVVIFVSPAAVRFAYALLPKLRFGRDICVCALGAATAQALRRHGVVEVEYPRTRHDSEGLLALAALEKLRGRRVALIGAAGGRDMLPRELRARGARLECMHVYLRRPPRLDRRHHAAIESATAPLITLISSVEILVNLHAILPAALFARLAVGDCVVSSLRVAQAARRLGCARVHVAVSATSVAMLAAACAALARHRL